MKKISLTIILLFTVLLIGCSEEQEEPTVEYDVAYINELFSALKYKSYVYEKIINKSYDNSDMLLLSEKTTVVKENDVYLVTKKVRKLDTIEGKLQYIDTLEEMMTKDISDPITIDIEDEHFSSTTINEKYFYGNIYNEFSKEVLGIDGISNIILEIILNDNLKVSDVKISYIDNETNFKVTIDVTYLY